jgi:hypothetical protein
MRDAIGVVLRAAFVVEEVLPDGTTRRIERRLGLGAIPVLYSADVCEPAVPMPA